MIPFLRPRPARLSQLIEELQRIEASGIFTNYGPLNAHFEARATEQLFDGRGAVLTVANATLGLMIAIREAIPDGEPRRYALMPSFTFAATAHAAIWCGLTPLFVDIDARTWCADVGAARDAIDRHRDQIACLVPYACFGNSLDLPAWEALAEQAGAGLVVDAAASLGSRDAHGCGFGSGFPHAVVYSMHATKTFATNEGGLVHSGDLARIERLRTMGNFGFGQARTATMPGLNSKLSEVSALLALARLDAIEEVVDHRAGLAAAYREGLPALQFQQLTGARTAFQFMPALLPPDLGGRSAEVVQQLARQGVEARTYFHPHLAEHPYFAAAGVAPDLLVTDQVASRVLSLPMSDKMTDAEVQQVCAAVRAALRELR